MNEKEALRLFERLAVILEPDDPKQAHFVYRAGEHGPAYVQKKRLFRHPTILSAMCEELAQRCMDQGIEAVVGPERGGATVAQWIAFHLAKAGRDVPAIALEKDAKNGFAVTDGDDDFLRGRRVLVADDVLNTGFSAGVAAQVAGWFSGVTIVGVAALFNRGDVTAEKLRVPQLWSLVEKHLVTWTEAECPRCAEGLAPNTTVGHGAEFLLKLKQGRH